MLAAAADEIEARSSHTSRCRLRHSQETAFGNGDFRGISVTGFAVTPGTRIAQITQIKH